MVELSMPLLEYHANRTIPAVGHENSDIYLNLCWKNMFNFVPLQHQETDIL